VTHRSAPLRIRAIAAYAQTPHLEWRSTQTLAD
jgi:hypothetical protein